MKFLSGSNISLRHTMVTAIACFVIITIPVQSCTKLNEEDLVAEQQLCHVDTVSYSQHIQPALNRYCMPCHSTAEQEGGIILETYNDVSTLAGLGTLMGVIKHESGYLPMPNNAPKLSDCIISGFQKWIDQGTKNN